MTPQPTPLLEKLADALEEFGQHKDGKLLSLPMFQVITELRAALASQAPALPQQGWVLVPIEPTSDMQIAFRRNCGAADTFRTSYAAMLAALPPPPKGEQHG